LVSLGKVFNTKGAYVLWWYEMVQRTDYV